MRPGIARAEEETTYHDMIEKLIEIGPPEKHQKKVRLCETMVFDGHQFQKRIYAWKYHEKKGVPQVEVFQIGYQNEGQKPYLRNICWAGCAGYMIAFPGDKCRSYYMGSPGMVFEPWQYRQWSGRFNPGNMFYLWGSEVFKKDPSLKYYAMNNASNALEEIDMFRRHPQSESLFKLGLATLAMQKRLYELSPSAAKQVIRYISKHLDEVKQNQNLNVILGCIARDISIEQFARECKGRKIKRDEYLQAQNADVHSYVEYLSLAKDLGYDMKDSKHVFPRDFWQTYKALRNEADKVAKRKVDQAIARIKKKLSSFEGTECGYRFALPEDFRDFRDHAEALGNCLVNNEYYKRHAKGQCIIVFVFDLKGKRVATAEFRNGEMQQFTGNQKHNDWRPSEPIQHAMDLWINHSKACQMGARA